MKSLSLPLFCLILVVLSGVSNAQEKSNNRLGDARKKDRSPFAELLGTANYPRVTINTETLKRCLDLFSCVENVAENKAKLKVQKQRLAELKKHATEGDEQLRRLDLSVTGLEKSIGVYEARLNGLRNSSIFEKSGAEAFEMFSKKCNNRSQQETQITFRMVQQMEALKAENEKLRAELDQLKGDKDKN